MNFIPFLGIFCLALAISNKAFTKGMGLCKFAGMFPNSSNNGQKQVRRVEILELNLDSLGQEIMERNPLYNLSVDVNVKSDIRGASISGKSLWNLVDFFDTQQDCLGNSFPRTRTQSLQATDMPLVAGETVYMKSVLFSNMNLSNLVCPDGPLYLCVEFDKHPNATPPFTVKFSPDKNSKYSSVKATCRDTSRQFASRHPSTHSEHFKGNTTRFVTDHSYATGSTGTLGNRNTISHLSSQRFTSGDPKDEETTPAWTGAVSEASIAARPQCPLLLEYKTNTIYQYRYLEIPVGSRCIYLEVKAYRDVHIVLSPSNGNSSVGYEIVIGGWKNTKSVIRRCIQCQAKISVTTTQYLTGNEFRRFWITFGSGGAIAVGRDNESTPFMEWIDPVPLDLHYLGYSTGFGSSGEFRFCISG